MTAALAAVPQAPSAGSVILGILAVVLGALLAATAAHQARRTGNWLYHLGTIAGLLIVAGVAGQRTAGEGEPIGPWDAGITVPVVGVRLTPVSAAGIILAVLALTLVLLFEHVQDPAVGRAERAHRPLEDDDAI